jgi:Tol biopolymer transport system component/DNA-binding winged helix-turn-helix (wHTH) protein
MRRIIRFDAFEIDLAQGELRRDGQKIRLQDQPFQLLAALLERPGEVVSRETLRTKLWPGDTFVDFDHSLNAAIKRLRDALGDDPENPQLIETVPRRGYRFLPHVSQPESPRPISRFLRLPLLASLALAAILGVTAAHRIFSGQASGPPMRIMPLTTSPGIADQPAFSRDGDQVAFVWDGNSSKGTDVYLKRIGTDRPLQLTQTNGFVCCAAWTSEDRYVAFLRCSGQNQGIFLVPSLGGQERILRKMAGCRGLSASPDGPTLVYADGSPGRPSALFRMSLNDLQPHQLTFPASSLVGDQDPVFSPDGKSVGFIRIIGEATADIYTVPVSGGTPRQMTFDKTFVNGMTWTADASKIVFSSSRDGGQSLWVVPLAGGNPTRLALGGAAASHPAISRNGDRLAYRQGMIHPNLWTIEISNSRAKSQSRAQPFFSSSAYNNGPQFSPDGAMVAFSSSRSGNNEIWTCAAVNCSEPQQLTSLKSVSGTPRWSPDGKKIAFDSRPKGHSQVLVVNAEGGTPVAITDGVAEDKVPSWSSDGKFVYFLSNRDGSDEIWKVSASGGSPSQVTHNGGFAAFESADGRFLYYAKGDDQPGIWRIPSGGGDEVQILPRPSPQRWGDWALSDRGIYYADESGARPAIEFYSFSNRRTIRVAEVEGLPPFGDPGFTVSPDGKRIIFSQVDRSSVNLVLVEHFH